MAWMLIVLCTLFLFAGLAAFFVPVVRSRQLSSQVVTKKNWALFWIFLFASAATGFIYSQVD
ncbi:hypothetical protein DBZ45_10610 [Arthrobacter globiformis]|uniref:Uncharacterized protein n=1 Tax=Arthrobacter globiformis TaxID=1665 RepID=A0A328HF32_ARTGO|nr:hypothetical protein DBZ45_10610 [Arthrobacter globiformis]